MTHIAQANLALAALDHLRCMEWGPVMPGTEYNREKCGRDLTPNEDVTKDIALTTIREFLNQDLLSSKDADVRPEPKPSAPPTAPPQGSQEIPDPQPGPVPTSYPWPPYPNMQTPPPNAS